MLNGSSVSPRLRVTAREAAGTTHQAEGKPQADQRGVRGGRGGGEDRLGAAVPHAVLRVRMHGTWRTAAGSRPPTCRTRASYRRRRRARCEAAGRRGSARGWPPGGPGRSGRASDEVGWSSFRVRLGVCVCVCVHDDGVRASLGPASGGLINCPMLRSSGDKYTVKLETEVLGHERPGECLLHPGRTTTEDIRSARICPVVQMCTSDCVLHPIK